MRHMVLLERQQEVEEEEAFLVAAKSFPHGTVTNLPIEIINSVLAHVPTNNRLVPSLGPNSYVDGLLPYAVYSPSLLLPYFEKRFSNEWTLEVIAKQDVKHSVLEDVSLTNHIRLRAKMNHDNFSPIPLLTKYPQQWKKLDVSAYDFDVDAFINVFNSHLLRLEDLIVHANFVKPSSVVVPAESCLRLKTVYIPLRAFSDFVNSGILNSITSLNLYRFHARQFLNHDAFERALNDLPRLLSQLPRLYEVSVGRIVCEHNDLVGLPRVKSTSLRSLEIGALFNNSAIAFLKLFADCSIDHITVHADFLQEVEICFGKVRRVCVERNIPGILFERKQDGSLAFPEMEQMELRDIRDLSEDNILQIQDHLLQTVRIRYEDPTVRRVGHLRIPRNIVTNRQFQDELERHVPSLVLL